MAVDTLTWPAAPTNTDGSDGGTVYQLGVVFGVEESAECPGAQWARVPDTIVAPGGGSHYATLWRVDSPSWELLRSQVIEPTAGVSDEQYVWTAGAVTLDPAFDYFVGVVTANFPLRAAGGAWNFNNPGGEITALAGRLGASATPSVEPTTPVDSYYYFGPLIGTIDGAGSVDADVTVTLPAVDLVASADVSADVEVTLTLPALDLVTTADVLISTEVTLSLPALDLIVSGESLAPVTAGVALTLPALDLIASGTSDGVLPPIVLFYPALLASLKAALSDSRLRVESDPSATVGRRSVVVGPPAFEWTGGMCDPNAPDVATYQVYLIESLDERAIPRLLAELPALIEAVQSIEGCLVTACSPGAFPSGSSDLPCYQLTVSMDL